MGVRFGEDGSSSRFQSLPPCVRLPRRHAQADADGVGPAAKRSAWSKDVLDIVHVSRRVCRARLLPFDFEVDAGKLHFPHSGEFAKLVA